MKIPRGSDARLKILLQVRFYRKKFRPAGSHISLLKHRQNDTFQEREYRLQGESVESVERDLRRLGFKSLSETGPADDLFVHYLDTSSSPFKKSTAQLKSLKLALMNAESQGNDKMKALFDFVLKESEREVKRIENMGPEQIYRMQSQTQDIESGTKNRPKSITSEKDLEQAIFSDLQDASDADNSMSLLPNIENMFRILSDLNMRRLASSDIISVEQMVMAFEIAKLIPISEFRQRGVLLSGHLLYSLGKVRMDPVNESFYIESLVFYGFYKKALELFNTNREKVNQRWWYEMGMMVCLRANQLAQFDKLLDCTFEKFGSDYCSPKVLRTAIRKKLYIRDFKGSKMLTKLFLRTVSTVGWTHSKSNTGRAASRTVLFTDEKQADDFLNGREQPTEADFIAIIQYHLFRNQKEEALDLLAKLILSSDVNHELLTMVVIKLKLFLLKNFGALKTELQPYLGHDNSKGIEKMRIAFEGATVQMNVRKIRKTYDNILFDNITAIASQPRLAEQIQRFALDPNQSPDPSRHDLSVRESSIQMQNILKSLLKNDMEAQALEVLTNLENLRLGSHTSEVNAHHYTVFIDHYSHKAQRSQNDKDIEKYRKQIAAIVERMASRNLQYNSTLLSSLLKHYRSVGDFDNCFNIVNSIFDHKLAKAETSGQNTSLESFFERRQVTKPLYLQLWKSLDLYNSFFDNGLGITERRSNHGAWKRNLKRQRSKINIHPAFDYRNLFKTMVRDDNVLPDANFYEAIIKGFVRVRDWPYVLATLKYMREISGLEVDKKLERFINGGLRLEYIAIERERLREIVSATHDFNTPLINSARRSVENRIKSGQILGDDSQNEDLGCVKNILDFVNAHRPETLVQVQEALEELEIR
ncbi:LADA_0H19724g1_1 [Lachancea dasiensis]|uniref:LADA_0H19724g1_1 n=1 Tax=Lachancea dasiensis TaxID=1072105 RepID=A0A1G4K6F2_9SACH|nr:LADA_0H19724g1_1 [Lachancea dasiensis]